MPNYIFPINKSKNRVLDVLFNEWFFGLQYWLQILRKHTVLTRCAFVCAWSDVLWCLNSQPHNLTKPPSLLITIPIWSLKKTRKVYYHYINGKCPLMICTYMYLRVTSLDLKTNTSNLFVMLWPALSFQVWLWNLLFDFDSSVLDKPMLFLAHMLKLIFSISYSLYAFSRCEWGCT